MVQDLEQIREARIKQALRDQFSNGHVHTCDALFMLEMLDRGLIGMDGFKFCEVIEAQLNRRICLKQIMREGI